MLLSWSIQLEIKAIVHRLGLVFQSCHKHSGLKQHLFYYIIGSPEVLAWLSQILCLGYHEAEIRVWIRLHLLPEAQILKDIFPIFLRFLPKFTSCKCIVECQHAGVQAGDCFESHLQHLFEGAHLLGQVISRIHSP